MNLFDRLADLLSFADVPPEPEEAIDQTLKSMETRLSEARYCAALAIAAECRFRRELDRLRSIGGHPAPDEQRHELEVKLAVLRLTVDEVRRALGAWTGRLTAARCRRAALQTQQTAALARRELCGPAADSLRAEFERLDEQVSRLEGLVTKKLDAGRECSP